MLEELISVPAAADVQAAASAAANLPPGLVAVPSLPFMHAPAVTALLRLNALLPPGSRVVVDWRTQSQIPKRNILAQMLLDAPDLRWLLFLDADMVPPPDAVTRLLTRAKPIVGALYFARYAPYPAAAIFKDAVRELRPPYAGDLGVEGRNLRGLIEVLGVGTGCMLLDRRVFEQMPRPWFQGADRGPFVTEDFDFCFRAREAGFPIYLDADVVAGHLDVGVVDRSFAAGWNYAHMPTTRGLPDVFVPDCRIYARCPIAREHAWPETPKAPSCRKPPPGSDFGAP